MLIYLITNKVNQKLYVGQTTLSPEVRWKGHLKVARSALRNSRLAKAIRKYGTDNFSMRVIDRANSQQELDSLEQKYILELSSMDPAVGYNGTIGGCGGVPTDETRKKISIGRTGKGLGPISEERKKKIADAVRGYRHTEQTKIKISEKTKEAMTPEVRKKLVESHIGFVVTEETRRKLSAASTGRYPSEETRRKMSQAAMGRSVTKEARKKISETLKKRALAK